MYAQKHSLAAVVISLLAAIPVQASEAEPEEIVVTAQRRTERLADVPMSVSVLGADELTNSGIRSPQDLITSLANVEVGEPLGNAFPMYVIRGVGLNDYNVNNNPTVGVYRDDVFLSSNAMIPKVLFDLKRVEVLKGPQGTLYGRNSTAGAINFLSADPGQVFNGYAVMGYGNFETLDTEGAVGGPVADNAGLRVSGYAERRFGGHQFNRLNGQKHGEIRAWGLRGIATYAPTDALDFRLTLNGGRDTSDTFYFQHRGVLGPQCRVATEGVHDPAACTDVFGYHDVDGDKRAGDYNRVPRVNDSNYGATLKSEWNAGSWTLASITNVEHFRFRNTKDEDSSPWTVVQLDYDSRIRQISQEVRAASGDDGNVNWLLGAIVGHYRHEENRRANISDIEATLGPIFGSGILGLPYLQITKTGAAFGDLRWKVMPTVTLEGGLRFTRERVSYEGGTLLPLLGNASIVQVMNRIETDKLVWRTNLSYAPTQDVMAYAQVSTGFKSGGFFGGYAFSPAELAPYRPETVTAYEIGTKLQMGRSLFVQGAGFIYDYKDLQALAISSVGSGGAITIPTLRNLPGAAFYGADLEIAWSISPTFKVRGALGLLDTRIKGPAFSFGSAGAAGPVFNLAGNEVPRAPHLSASTTATYRKPINAALDASAEANVSYRSKTYMDLNNFPMATQSGFAVFNARLAISSRYGGWQLSAWGKNLTNIMPYLGDAQIGFGERDLIVYGMPRTYGIEARLDY